VDLLSGVFNEDRTVVTGLPDKKNKVVLENVRKPSPSGTIVIPLTKRNNWEAIKLRLTDEGF
jgi:hypothetical protein